MGRNFTAWIVSSLEVNTGLHKSQIVGYALKIDGTCMFIVNFLDIVIVHILIGLYMYAVCQCPPQNISTGQFFYLSDHLDWR